MNMDPTPATLRRTAAHEFGESWLSPGVQKYLGAAFGSPAPAAAAPSPARDATAEGRVQQTLAMLQRKPDSMLGSGAGSTMAGGAPDRIPVYQPSAIAQAGAAPSCGGAAPGSMGDALAADYRAQLQRYAQQLAAKEAEVTSLRKMAAELKQQAAAAESRAAHASEQLSRHTATAGQLEAANAAMERQLAEREAEVAAAGQARRAAEQAAAAARAQAAAAQKASGGRAAEFEAERRYFKEQLERRDEELHSLEEALRKQAADLERRSREWANREAELSAVHTRSHGASAAVQAELGVAQDALETANKRMRALEADNADLRRQKAAAAADLRMLEELLSDGDAERRELHDKYVRLGERMEGLVKEGKILKSSASAESGAARSTVQDALKEAEKAVKERSVLAARVRELQGRLEEETAARSALKDKVQSKLAAAEQEVSALRGELEGKARQLQGLQADMKSLQADAETKLGACEKQVLAFKDRAGALKQELESECQRCVKAKETAESLYSERLKVELHAQALKYERRIQELELHALGGSSSGGSAVLLGSPAPSLRPGGSVLDYIPRAEHLRLLEARLGAKESDMQLEVNGRVAQVEREWQWKLESKEQEIASLTARTRQLEDDMHTERQRASSQAHKLGDEAKRLGTQCLELQRELEVQTKEVARLKETLKDARSANADMDDDALSSSRQVARLRHALEDSQGALKEAQAVLVQERKRCEDAQREAEAQAEKSANTGRRCDRLAGEVAELQAALEQKQELITALQAQSDAWSAKLMAHREYHEQEVEALRRAAKEESEARVRGSWGGYHGQEVEAVRQAAKEESEARISALEQQCQAQTDDLRHVRQQHEEALGQLCQQHAAQVAHLETQLAGAERCSAELRDITTALGSVRQEDVESLRAAVSELQVRLKQAAQEREREQRLHAGQLAALSGQVAAKLAAFRAQQAQLKQHVEAEVTAATADCLASYEAGLAALSDQLDRQQVAAEGQRAELMTQMARLQGAMQQLLAALRGEVPSLPEAALQVLQDGGGGSVVGEPCCKQQVAAAAQQVAAAVQAHMERAEAAAIHSALAAMEAELLPAATAAAAGGAASAPASPRKLMSRSQRQQQQVEAAAASAFQQQQHVPSVDANEGRLAALLARSHELLAQVAAGEAQIVQLRQQVAALEASNAGYADKYSRAKEESVQAADAARAAAVALLQAEVARLTERVQNLQQLHASELAAIESAARQQAAAAQAEAQAVVDRLSASGSSLQQQLRGECQRADGLAADLARMQDDLAKHTQRAASKIELQTKELEMLKRRIREMEVRDASSQQELRSLRQREREQAAALAAARG